MRSFVQGRLPFIPFADTGLNFVHVDDVARGIVLVLDRGQAGRSYVLGGEIARVGDAFEALARVTGRGVPRLTRALRAAPARRARAPGSARGRDL